MALLAAGQAVASALLDPVCERLINTALEEYALVRGVKGEIEKLRSTVGIIQDVLQDAEGKQVGSKVVRTWLSYLKQILFDAEDVLDEVATNAALRGRDRRLVRANAVGAKVRNVICCFGTVHNFLDDHGIAHQIKHIREMLDAKSKEINSLGLQILGVGNLSGFSRPRRPPTSSLPDSDIIGRNDDKKNLEELLLVGCEDGTEGSSSSSSSSNNVQVISITGMGGVGKTTLVGLVYNSPRVKQHFHPTIWVCVSNDFDLERISREIMGLIPSSDMGEEPRKTTNWDEIQTRIKEKIEGKRFLLVLDDMWAENDHDNWERLCKPLRYGGKGSKIVVTARSQKVSHMVRGTHIPLAILSSENLWSTFERFAFEGCDQNKHTQLEPVGRQIADKLKGLPLAAKIVGRLLNSQLDVMYWQSILRSERWAQLSDDPNDILPILKLSYDELPGHLKQCFAYCSLFPKDYSFSKDELVQLWTAQNFIHVPKGSHADQSDMNKQFDDLLHASFFEQSSGSKMRFVMHDLIHDLAESVSEDDSFKLVKNDRNDRIPETVRHVSIVSFDPTRLDKLCKLRTLLFSGYVDLSPHLDVLFRKFKRLRVLSLHRCKIKKLPKSIGTLKHLRYVDLSSTLIHMLPESICNLHNLQVLKLQHCRWLRALPGNMSALVNLMHLEVSYHELVNSIQDLGKLTALQELDIRGVKAKELGDMSMLRHLRIRDLVQVTRKDEAVQARLDAKKYLETLNLEWTDDVRAHHPRLDDHQTLEEGVLEGLQPVHSIRELSIHYYGGVRSPRWLEDPSWVSSSFLERVTLTRCKNWEVLPPLGQLRSLKELRISSMSSVRRIDPLFFLGGCYPPGKGGGGGGGFEMLRFPSLESLFFGWMLEWEEWEAPHHHGDDDEEEGQQQQVSFLPRLHTLEIIGCPKLKELPPLPRSLKSLDIRKVGLISLPRLVGCCGGGGDAGRDADHMSSPSLSELSIRDCPNLRSLDDGDDDDEEGQQQQVSFLPLLRTLGISDCPKLKELPPLPRSLERLKIQKVGLTRLPRLVGCCGGGAAAGRDDGHMSSPSLSEFSIHDCPNLRSLHDDDGLLQHPLPRLLSLSIKGCRELTSLPVRAFAHLTSLTQLEITDCPKLSSSSSSSSSLPSVSTADEANMPCSLKQVDIIDGGDMVEYLLVASIMPKLTCLSRLSVSVGSSSTAQLLLNGILQNQPVTATLRSLEIRRDHHHGQQHQACSSSSNIPSLIVPPASPPPLQMEKVVVGPTNNIPDHLTSLTFLKIGDCSDLLQLSGLPSSLEYLSIYRDTHLDDRILATYLQGLCHLRHLWIEGCRHITSLPTAEVLCHLTALQALSISYCEELMSWGGGVHNLIALQELTIEGCPKLKWLPSVDLPKSLRVVRINGSSIPTRH